MQKERQKVSHSWIEFFGVIAVMALINYSMMALSAKITESEIRLFLNCLKPIIQSLVLFLFLHIDMSYKTYLVKPIKASDFLYALLVFVAFYASALFGSLFNGAQNGLVFDFVAENAKKTISFALLLQICVFALGVSCYEELFYRFYIHIFFKIKGISAYKAIVFSALFFASGHLYQGTSGFISAILMGFVASIAVEKNVKLVSLVLAHAVYDFCVLFFAFCA